MNALTVWTRLVLLAFAVTTLPACGTMYLAQAARGQWQVMHARKPIEQLLADPATPTQLRARLNEVREARAFASQELGLPDNRSYRTYADVKRPYVVWNVVATPEFSIEPRRWCFPIAGCVAYRGYFKEKSAQAFAADLRSQGFDVFVGGVPAYSTLGKLSDPVLNTMLPYGDAELASIMFHELSHQVVYVPGDSEFNEAFAVTVEQEGLARWLTLRGHANDIARLNGRRVRQQQYVLLFTRIRKELAALYAQKLPREQMRAHKREIFASLEAGIRALEKQLGARSSYDDWIAEGLNNAHLASVATYFDCVPGFERMLAANKGDLRLFYAAARDLAKQPRAERHAYLCLTPSPPKPANDSSEPGEESPGPPSHPANPPVSSSVPQPTDDLR